MARDIFHQEVREALEKDGWTITHDPVPIEEQVTTHGLRN
ncbi:MAG: element excision factor XisH family protein [Saprospiraceae bacterium]